MGTEIFSFHLICPRSSCLKRVPVKAHTDLIGLTKHTDVILVKEKGIIPPGQEHHIEKVQLNLNKKFIFRTE